MERKKIYEIIDGEREYQNTIRKENEGETQNDDEKTVADFLLYMDNQLTAAKYAHYKLQDPREYIRKVIALGVACGEAFGLPERRK